MTADLAARIDDPDLDVTGDDFVAFDPGLPVLPAQVRDGQEWTAAGTATIGKGATSSGRQPYAATMSARALDDGCVAISTELTVRPTRPGPAPLAHSVTGCTRRPRKRRAASRRSLGVANG